MVVVQWCTAVHTMAERRRQAARYYAADEAMGICREGRERGLEQDLAIVLAGPASFPNTYLFNRGPQAPLGCRRGPFPGTYMIRYAGYAG